MQQIRQIRNTIKERRSNKQQIERELAQRRQLELETAVVAWPTNDVYYTANLFGNACYRQGQYVEAVKQFVSRLMMCVCPRKRDYRSMRY